MTQEPTPSQPPRTEAEVLAAIEKAARSLRRQEVALGILSFVVGLGYLLVMLSGYSVSLRNFVTGPRSPAWFVVASYLILFTVIYDLVHFPVSYLREYVVERRFRLSKQRFRRWLWSQAKKVFVSTLLLVGLGEVIYYFLSRFEKSWWLWAWAVYLFFGLILSRFGARVILPLFYKRAEIEDLELTSRIEHLVTRAGFEVESVKRIILEKDTRRANAAVVGLGNSKEILISDTLISGLTHEEIEAVVAHELGHLKSRHGEWYFALGMVVSFIGFALAAGVLELSAKRLGFSGVKDVAGFPLFLLVFAGLFLVLSPFLNSVLRRMEKAADLWVGRFTGNPLALASALEKLSATNLVERNQPWLYEVLFSSHPSPGKRIAYLRKAVPS